jgi:hypothetical protein
MSPGKAVSFMPRREGWHLAIQVLSIGITQEHCMKPPDPNLYQAGICPCLVLWRGTYPRWLSPTYDDLDSTQILAQHYGA